MGTLWPRSVRVTGVVLVLLVAWPMRGDDAPRELLTTQAASGALPGWESLSEQESTPQRDVWQLRDGVLRGQGTPRGYLYTVDDYRNFTLTLEWRWPPGTQPGNGGVLVRTTGPHKIWPRSFEAQINAGQAGDIWGLDGYVLAGPPERSQEIEHAQFGKLTHVKKLANLEKPDGEWNRYEIIARDGTITMRINGELANEAHDCEDVAGKICLTAEGDAIEFRHVRLTAH